MKKRITPLKLLLVGTALSAALYLGGYLWMSLRIRGAEHAHPAVAHLCGLILAGPVFMAVVVVSMFLYMLRQSRLWRRTGRGGLSFDAWVMLGLLFCVAVANLVCFWQAVAWPSRAAQATALVAALTVLALTLWVWVRVRHRWGWIVPGLPRAIVGFACALVTAGWLLLVVFLRREPGDILLGSLLLLGLLYLCGWAFGLLTLWDGEFSIQCRIAHNRRASP